MTEEEFKGMSRHALLNCINGLEEQLSHANDLRKISMTSRVEAEKQIKELEEKPTHAEAALGDARFEGFMDCYKWIKQALKT